MTRTSETQKDTAPPKDPLSAPKPIMPTPWLGNGWMETLADLGTEITTFVAERIKEDVKTQHALLHCKSLAEVQQVQAGFLQKAFDQYQAETGKLVEMSGRMAAHETQEPGTNG